MRDTGADDARKRIVKWLSKTGLAWIGGVASLVSLMSFIVGGVAKVPGWVFAVGYFILAFGLLAITLYEVRKRRWCETELSTFHSRAEGLQRKNESLRARLRDHVAIYPQLHSILHRIRDHLHERSLDRWSDAMQTERVRNVCREVLTDLSQIFSRLTGATCACSMKLFEEGGAPPMETPLVTFCRDRDSERKRGEMDGQERFHVANNSDFHQIVNSAEDNYWLCNDLSKMPGYMNERSNWRRRYMSALVLPIQRGHFEDEPKGYHDLMGFLCIDSLETGIFDQEHSVELGACVADSLYLPLHEYLEAEEKEQHNG